MTFFKVPSAPSKVKVSQVGQRLLITWKPPYDPNGPIVAYRM